MFRFSKKFLIFIVLIISQSLHAQSFRSGYVITTPNDSIEGLLKYRKGKKAARECIFKLSKEAKGIHYLPNEIYGYAYKEGKYYISKQRVVGKDTIFLFFEYLIKGVANMYYLIDDKGDHYFIETERNGMVELSDEDRIMYTEEGPFLAPSLY